ncbi:hypothetical protein SCOCK_100222 [Actinacidiphila cocklensis]|uniref:Uncharacterized protein n=1 Tax=Actinacidiphila cocklensis TaxID=887465 RepID=A0A9W4DGY2_9ACTN|nr:hypothetical protein SCOCK_100222 [Actinacidiphila cocklensis]
MIAFERLPTLRVIPVERLRRCRRLWIPYAAVLLRAPFPGLLSPLLRAVSRPQSAGVDPRKVSS